MDVVESGAPAPVETVPATEIAVPAPDAPAVQEQAEQPVQAPKTYTEEETRKLVNERLTKERRRLERAVRAEIERDYLKQQLEARNAPQQREQPQGKPKEEDFAGRPYSEYVEALAVYHAKQMREQEKSEEQRLSREQQARQQEARFTEAVHQNVIAVGEQKYPDFTDVTTAEGVAITPTMLAAAAKLKNGADALYHLGTNPKESQRIASLSDIEQVWELKDLSSKLSAPPRTTKAPPPIVPNTANASVEKRLEDASIDEFFAIRKRQIAAKKGR